MVTVVNHKLIRIIKFVSRISTHLLKMFYKKNYLIFLNNKILFDVR